LAEARRAREIAMMKVIIRKASVRWKGGAKGGSRTVTTESGVLSQAKCALSFPLKDHTATDPAELMAAAQASSFSLALAHELGSRAFAAGEIITTAAVTLEHLGTGWAIMNIHLDIIARLPKVTQSGFIDAAVRAKTNCLVSRLLRANVSMHAKLAREAAEV
jgi:lipoyl-dependent peroxiredoxin